MRSNCVALIVLTAAFALAACHRRAPVAGIPPTPPPPVVRQPLPPPPVSPGPEPLPTIAKPPVVFPLEVANRAFSAGNYDEAARAYEAYLRANPSDIYRDEALFNLGLSYILRPGPSGDWKRAAATFKQLIEEHPHSQ